ncbi:uncharacterized protein C21orf58 isoform X1 [Hypanus sabinus]|uniref:uncharacterized protein C21orf58 isoform X1 n=1 Tax=Hypanus sabinus TaxID=79690 RepID=UPI0028C46AF0|nr:uncharacterized protein C21orf58 isoform X1 [Hypanus sabinus]XP_059823388.1 uncharacterized protein C21orf58 isoform X1 [Hypanus sabinus]
MRMETADPSLVDQMTRLKLKLLEKKLENEREILDGHSDTAESTARSFDGQGDALHNALKRKKGLLQKLREQHMLDESSRPHTWGGTRRRYPRLEPIQQAPPIHVYHQPPPEQPRIIQHPYPQQPATIIQQLPQQQPLITQIPPPQALPPIRSGSIKEDMVELMLMQNAQMHQIIMHNMMLKALPPMAYSQPGASPANPVVSHGQDIHSAVPLIVKAEKPRPSSVHHHHHYSSQGQPTAHPPPLPPIGHPLWTSMLPSHPVAHHNSLQPSVQHMMGPTVTLPTLQTELADGNSSRMPPGL